LNGPKEKHDTSLLMTNFATKAYTVEVARKAKQEQKASHTAYPLIA